MRIENMKSHGLVKHCLQVSSTKCGCHLDWLRGPELRGGAGEGRGRARRGAEVSRRRVLGHQLQHPARAWGYNEE